MSFIVQDYVKYITRPILAATAITLYNIFIQGYDIKDKILIYDAGIMSGSILSTKLLNDLIVDNLKISDKSLQFSLIQPIVNAFLYTYIYNFVIRNKYLGKKEMRDNNINYIVGGTIAILLSFIENPLVNFFTGIKQI